MGIELSDKEAEQIRNKLYAFAELILDIQKKEIEPKQVARDRADSHSKKGLR